MIVIYIIIGYVALYSVIWLHEVGHAIMYKKYGCKSNAFRVSVPLYFAFSTPMPVDLEKIQSISKKDKFYISIAGIIVNIIFGFMGLLIIRYLDLSGYLYFFIYAFTVFHFTEAASYTVLNNIYVASDIKGVNEYKPILRIPLFILGSICTYIIVMLINNSDSEWQLGLLLTTVTIAFLMGVLRIIFGIINSRKRN